MKQVRKMTVQVTIESSKTKPFKITCASGVMDDKFILVEGKERQSSLVSAAIHGILSQRLKQVLE